MTESLSYTILSHALVLHVVSYLREVWERYVFLALCNFD